MSLLLNPVINRELLEHDALVKPARKKSSEKKKAKSAQKKAEKPKKQGTFLRLASRKG